MKILIYVLIVAGVFSCSESNNREKLVDVSSPSYDKSYTVVSDFKYELAKYLREDVNNHRGIKSLLEIGGVSFAGNSSVAYDGGNNTLHFYAPEVAHRELQKLIVNVSNAK